MELYKQYAIGNGKIPDAPKMPSKQAPAQKITKFPKALISKSAGSKTQNPPQLPAMSAREELMMAIRNRGGVQGLRKVTLLKKQRWTFYLIHSYSNDRNCNNVFFAFHFRQVLLKRTRVDGSNVSSSRFLDQ